MPGTITVLPEFASRKHLPSRLAKLRELDGRTAVIATHRVPILQLTDRTMILQNGRLAVDGPRDQVLEHLRTTGQGAA